MRNPSAHRPSLSLLPWSPGREGRGYVAVGADAHGRRHTLVFVWTRFAGTPNVADVMAHDGIQLRSKQIEWATVVVDRDGRAVLTDPRDVRRRSGLEHLARALAQADERLSVQVRAA